MLSSQGMWASPARGAAGLSTGEGWKQVLEPFCFLRGTSSSSSSSLFFLLKMALCSLTTGTYFFRSRMGRCLLNSTFNSWPRAGELPVRAPAAPLCSAHYHGGAAARQHQGPQWLTTKRCLRCWTTSAACPQLQMILPGSLHPLYICAWSWGASAAACGRQSWQCLWETHLWSGN